jgi:hypothetical protein
MYMEQERAAFVVAGLSDVSSFLFWLVAQRMLAFTDVSGQCMGPIFMEKSVIFGHLDP